jgi:hypothetical protein
MADKTPAEKMRLRSGMTAVLLQVPDELDGRLGVPAGVSRVDDPARADFVLCCVTTQAEAEACLGQLAAAVGPTTVAWLAYPKGSSAAGYDLNRDTIAAFARTLGLAGVAMVALSETWSALRVRRQ